MIKSRFILLLFLALLVTNVTVLAQNADSSGDSLLKGSYFVRHVAFDGITAIGTVARGRSITGTISFDGNGNYTETGQLSDSTVSSGAPQSITLSGTYAVSSSGVLILTSPLVTGDYVYGGVGVSAVVASSTEGNILDMMVAVPMGSNTSTGSLQGSYDVGSIEYPGGDITQSKNSLFVINADGQGNLGNLTVNGHSAALQDADTTQTISGATYTLSSTAGTLTFPTGSAGANQLVSGSKQFFLSADGNVLVGGATNGYDMIVGIKAIQGVATNANFYGTYFTAGTDSDLSGAAQDSYYIDGYYGSLNANGQGTVIAHQRINPSDSLPYDYTVDDEFTMGSNGEVQEPYEQFYIGANGAASLLIGRSTTYSLELAVTPLTLPTSGAVILNPVAVWNAANYAPITNPIAPGEMINLYGTGLAPSTQVASGAPFPASLGGVSVSIGGVAAPMYYVSPNEIVCIVPFELSANFATVQVTNNGVASNSVTLYTEYSAPGVFTLAQDGVGPGAFLHPNSTVVSATNPANVGETIAGFLTGLGPVSPAGPDGAAAPSSPLSATSDQFNVYVDAQPASVSFAGLAPGFVGLYQVNFVVPPTPDTGEVYVDFEDANYGGYTSMATMNVSGSSAALATKAIRAANRSREKGRTVHPRRQRSTRPAVTLNQRTLNQPIQRSGS